MRSIHFKSLLVLCASALLFSCGATESHSSPTDLSSSSAEASSSDDSSKSSSETSSTSSNEILESTSSGGVSSSEESSQEATMPPTHYDVEGDASAFSISRDDGLVPENDNGVFLITEGGSYSCSGTLRGMLLINVPETDDKSGEIELNLEGVSMSYAGNSVIYCYSADKLEISAKKGTQNTITDLRELETEDVATQGGGAIYSRVDTKLKGTGGLSVTGTYNNGVHVTKDLTIQKLSLTVIAPNNAIKGKDSLSIVSGEVTAISLGGDGLKTVDSDISSKSKQRGDVVISGGTVNVFSACDGIQAAHDFILGVEGDEAAAPKVTVKTNKYSSYTDESLIQKTSTQTMYLKTSSYGNYRYAVRFYNDSVESGVWADAAKLEQGGGRRSTYYSLERPADYSSFALYVFSANSSADSLDSYVAKSAGATVNENFDTIAFTVNGSSISLGQWSNYSAQQGGFPGPGGQEGNTDKADVSAKGAKADNEIRIYGGTMDIECYDDGLHANYGTELENGSTGVGDILVAGGALTIAASDDGIHADRYLRVSGGDINVTRSYEALEGNQIYISGGNSVVYASDDAVNAAGDKDGANLTPLISVSSGYLFAAVPTSGDTDGIDSNGNYVQTGGTVIVAGPNSQNASAVDTDGTVTVNGGTLVVFGSTERTVNRGTGITASTKSGTYGGKAYTIAFEQGSVVTGMLPNYSYSSCRGYSDLGSISSIA